MLLISFLLLSLLVFVLLIVSCMLGSKSKADYTCQQMEHGSSLTQLYSLSFAELATHMLQPAENTGFFKILLEFEFS